MSLWQFYFGWYQGAVYSNLLASAITSSATAVVIVRRGVRKALERERARRTAELAEHHQAVTASVAAQLAAHHAAVMAAVAPKGDADAHDV